MRNILGSAAGLVLCLSAGVALAQAQPQQMSQPTTQPAMTANSSASSGNAGNEVICKSMTHNGSMIPDRTCRTRREWESLRYSNQNDVNTMQMRFLTSSAQGK